MYVCARSRRMLAVICCEVMHVCACMCLRIRCILASFCMHVPKVVCVHEQRLCLLLLAIQIRCMLMVIAARQCMHVWECVFGLVQGTWSLWLLQGDACMCGSVCVCFSLYKVHAHCGCCNMCQSFCLICIRIVVLISIRHACCGLVYSDCCDAMHVCQRLFAFVPQNVALLTVSTKFIVVEAPIYQPWSADAWLDWFFYAGAQAGGLPGKHFCLAWRSWSIPRAT